MNRIGTNNLSVIFNENGRPKIARVASTLDLLEAQRDNISELC